MGGRTARLTIQNELDFELQYQGEDVERGKIVSGEEPPTTIPGMGYGTFEVKNKSGAMKGPKGTVTYKLITSTGEEITVTFYWDHPWSHHISAYRVYSEPEGKVGYEIEPAQPKGHDQLITYALTALL